MLKYKWLFCPCVVPMSFALFDVARDDWLPSEDNEADLTSGDLARLKHVYNMHITKCVCMFVSSLYMFFFRCIILNMLCILLL